MEYTWKFTICKLCGEHACFRHVLYIYIYLTTTTHRENHINYMVLCQILPNISYIYYIYTIYILYRGKIRHPTRSDMVTPQTYTVYAWSLSGWGLHMKWHRVTATAHFDRAVVHIRI